MNRTPVRQAGWVCRGSGEPSETWIADGLDSVVHVYPFRPFQGDFQASFGVRCSARGFRRCIGKTVVLAEPAFTPLTVKGADAAMTASFRNFNGGVPREHLRVAVSAAGRVALVDISANSPQAFERHWPSVSRLLSSLQVARSGVSDSDWSRI